MPDWSSWEFWAKDIAPIAGGAIGLWLLFIRTRAVDRQAKTAADRHKEQTDADRERRITESFARAVEQLGNDKLEVRLGGVYTLERIAQESEHDYWPIMETLTAYVRERAPWPPPLVFKPELSEMEYEIMSSLPETEPLSEIRPTTDIQAVLTVLGRRDEKMREQDEAKGRRLDLSETDLRGANLFRAHLEQAMLWKANLEKATLSGAHLERAILALAHLEEAHLLDAQLEGADFAGANMKGADLQSARLEGAVLFAAHLYRADLREAHLEGAALWKTHLEGVNLREAKNLTQKQVDTAIGNEQTILPEGLIRPAHWLKTEADDEDAPPEE